MDVHGSFSAAEETRLIGRTLALYCQLLDDLRFEDWGELFAEDAEWTIPDVSFKGRSAIAAGLRAMEGDTPGWVKHLSFPPIVEFDGPTSARAWSDLVAMVRDRESGKSYTASTGRYYDWLEKIGGFWRFKRRLADIDTALNPLPGLEPPPSLFSRVPGH
jgi:hypothetical protein